MCAGRFEQVKANIFIQSATSGLGIFQFATDPPKSKFGELGRMCGLVLTMLFFLKNYDNLQFIIA